VEDRHGLDSHGLVVDTALLFAVVMLGLQEIKDGRPILRDLKAPARLVDRGGEEYPSLLPLQ